jgi:penicillin amidase
MKRFRKITFSILILLLLAVLAGVIVSNILAKRALPKYTGQVTIKTLSDSVEVYRDAWGTPHIIASNEKDLYRAVGFVMAQDRLWQMDLLRRVTLGRLSEIFGDDYVDTDLLLRSLEYSDKSKAIINQSPIHVIEALESFADGVNQYIEHLGDKLPLEFFLLGYQPDKWEVYQSLNMIGFMAWDLKAGWNELVLEQLQNHLDSALYSELMPHSNRFPSTVFNRDKKQLLSHNALLNLNKLDRLGVDILSGSNNWAVSGAKSATGKPLLANDMHLSYSVPGIWMQMHQVIPGKLNVSGLILPGQPLIVVGHNKHIAWGMTNTYVDNLDYYEEKINPEDSNQYLYNGEWLDFDVKEVIIKSSSDSVFKRFYRRTHRGPVVSEIKKIKDKVLSIHWVGDEPSNEMLSIYRLNRATNWEEFKYAMRTFRSVSQNIAYADTAGNIGLYACAGVPIRKRNQTFEVLPGWTDEYEWKRMVPFEELPHEYNPECGYVSSANNKTIDDSYPYHIGTWYSMPYRMDRIRELLDSQDTFSVEDFMVFQNDSYSHYAKMFMDSLLPFVDVKGEKAVYIKAIKYLEEWDGSMGKDLVAPSLFETTLFMLLENTFKDEMGEELYQYFISNGKLTRIALYNLHHKIQSLWIDDIATPERETLEQTVTASFMQAVDYLEDFHKKAPHHWKWGRMHQITLSHPLSKVEVLDKLFHLNRGPFQVNGSFHTIAPYSFSVFTSWEVSHGASHRHIFSVGDWDKTVSVIPTGNSGHIKSEFYMDQTKMFIDGEYHQDVFTLKAVVEQAKHKMVLLP